VEIHTSESDADQNWTWEVNLDTSSGELDWRDNARTDDDRFDKATDESTAGTVSVRTGTDGEADDETLLYSADGIATGRVRFAQLAFIDAFGGDDPVLHEATPFRTTETGDAETASGWRDEGYVSRIWSFSESDIDPGWLPPQFPATDTPLERWYSDWCEEIEVVE
jgi:hypothetical protein